MAEKMTSLLDRVCEMVAKRVDVGRIDAAKRRHADMFAWRASDYIPISLGAPVPDAADLWRRIQDEKYK